MQAWIQEFVSVFSGFILTATRVSDICPDIVLVHTNEGADVL
jgi:hypothetical protein